MTLFEQEPAPAKLTCVNLRTLDGRRVWAFGQGTITNGKTRVSKKALADLAARINNKTPRAIGV